MKIKYFSFFLLAILHFSLLQAQKKSPKEVITKKNKLINNQTILENITTLFDEKATIGYVDNQLAKGTEEITTYYENLLQTTFAVNTVVVDRITFKKYQIDKELVKTPDGTKERIVVYRIKKGKILRMYILQPNLATPSPISSVNNYIDAYRSSNLELFMSAFSPNILECDFPTRCNITGLTAMRNRYKEYVSEKTRVNYILEKRIISGNFIIDDNNLSYNSGGTHNIAVYSVDATGKIDRLSFLGF
ncbi:hypothetical protein [uncultured Dokdonia sp.]|uniref:hypothetical protein n=1 Tax=uncultured Dokdonia sp. TaxID=575653 RepID=UPI002603A11B|nr:hypothetical protein [uncultured Dokdonia sp.]